MKPIEIEEMHSSSDDCIYETHGGYAIVVMNLYDWWERRFNYKFKFRSCYTRKDYRHGDNISDFRHPNGYYISYFKRSGGVSYIRVYHPENIEFKCMWLDYIWEEPLLGYDYDTN